MYTRVCACLAPSGPRWYGSISGLLAIIFPDIHTCYLTTVVVDEAYNAKVSNQEYALLSRGSVLAVNASNI